MNVRIAMERFSVSWPGCSSLQEKSTGKDTTGTCESFVVKSCLMRARLTLWQTLGMSLANSSNNGQFGLPDPLNTHGYEYVRPSPCTPTVLKGNTVALSPEPCNRAKLLPYVCSTMALNSLRSA